MDNKKENKKQEVKRIFDREIENADAVIVITKKGTTVHTTQHGHVEDLYKMFSASVARFFVDTVDEDHIGECLADFSLATLLTAVELHSKDVADQTPDVPDELPYDWEGGDSDE